MLGTVASKKIKYQIQSEVRSVRTMYWLVHAKRHDNDFDVSLFLLAIVHHKIFIRIKKGEKLSLVGSRKNCFCKRNNSQRGLFVE
jgi:hypothetical protein